MTGVDSLIEWELEYWTQPFMELLGPVFPAAVAIFVIGILFVYTRSLAMPTVMSILLGGSIIQFLPPSAQNVGILLVFFGISGAIWMFFNGGRRL